MSDDELRHSLEELFSDFKPPAPEREPIPTPPPPEKVLQPPERVPQPPEEEPTPPPTEEAPSEEVALPTPERETGPKAIVAARTTSVRDRLIGSVLIVSSLLVAATILIFSSLGQMEGAVKVLHQDSVRMSTVLEANQTAVDLLTTLRDEAAVQDTVRFIEQVRGRVGYLDQSISALVDSVSELPPDDPLRVAILDFQEDLLSVRTLANDLLESSREGDWERILARTQSEFIAFHRDRLARSLDGVRAVAVEREAAQLAAIAAARETVRVIPLVWGGLIAMALTATTIVTIRSIARPVERLTEATARLAAGHLDERVPVERVDEFGRLAVAFNKMAKELQAYTSRLGERVAERTRELQEANYALQRRAVLLEASAEVGRAITSVFDIDELLRRTVNLIRERFGFYHAGIFLLDETGEWAVLREATGEAGERMKAQGHRLRVGETSMVGWTALHRQPRIALDVGEDAVHFDNPLLPYTRSEVTLPLAVGDRLLGVLDVQSTEEAAFDEDDVRALQNMADQIAIALENARRLSKETLLLEATSPIYRASRRLTTATTLTEVSDVVISTIAESGADGCMVVLFEPPGSEEPENLHFIATWRKDGQFALPPGTRLPLSASHMRVETMQRLWSVGDIDEPSLLTKEERAFFRRAGVRAVVNIPLRIGERPMGFVAAYRLTPGPFSEAALRLYEALIDQVSMALERARLLEATRQQAEGEAVLRALSDRIARSVDMGTILRSAAEGLGEALQAAGIYIELGPGPAARPPEGSE